MDDEIFEYSDEFIRSLIYECINSYNIEIVVNIILELKKNYNELAKLSTLGYYDSSKTHEDVIRYLTYEI